MERITMKLYEMPGVIVNVRTPEEAEEFFAMCREVGWVWNSGPKPGWTLFNNFEEYGDKTCFRVENYFTYADVDFYKQQGCKIITLKELKEILMGDYKVGDILVSRPSKKHKVKILAKCDYVYHISCTNEYGKVASTPYTKEELDGLYIKESYLEKDIVELTIEDISNGKGVGVNPKLIRIKEWS